MVSCDVLVVDDEVDSAELVERYLDDLDDCSVCVETDVGRAVGRVEENGFDLVVSDYDMDGLNGLDFFERVGSGCSFILFTGKGSESIASKAISMGVTDYIRKGGPEQLERLTNRVEKVLEKKTAEKKVKRQESLLEERNSVLRRFQELITSSKGFDEKVDSILELGIEYFGLESGIFSRIEGMDYTFKQFKGLNGVEEGDTVSLEDTFCQTVIESEGTVYYNGEYTSEIEEHPAYDKRELQVYIGMPIYVGDEIYGTLNFSSKESIGRQIDEDERTIVRLMTEWIGKEIESRKSMEEAQAKQKRLRQIIDNLPQLVFAKDENGEFLLANEAVANVYGTSVDKLEGATDDMFANSDQEVENFREDDMKVINSGEAKNIPEEPLTTSSGENRIYQTTKIPYNPAESENDAVLGVSHNITERKEREESLEKILGASRKMSKEKNEEEIAKLAVKTMETALDFGLCSMHEYVEDENVFKPLSASNKSKKLFDDMILEKENSLVGEAFEKNESRFYEDLEEVDNVYNPDRIIKSEIIIPVADYGILISGSRNERDFSQGEVYLAELLASITKASLERAEREEELEMKSSAIESTMDGIAITDNEGNYIYMNKAHAEMFGRSPEYFNGKNWSSLYPESEIKRIEKNIFPELQDQGSWIGETVGIHKDGSELIQEITLTMMEDGKLICTNRDVTEQRKSRIELEEKNRRLDEFNSIVSHDLRNPLNVAKGYLGLSMDSMNAEDLEKVENSLNRMENIIDELLAVSGDAENFQKVDVVLSEVFMESLEMIEPEVEYSIEEDLELEASKTGLVNIFDNLVSNSVDHNGENVSVKIGALDNGFYFTDDGSLDADLQDIVEHGFTTSDDGRGLGLSIVRRLANANDWNVELEKSEEGSLIQKFYI